MVQLTKNLNMRAFGFLPDRALAGLVSVANHEIFRRRGYVEREFPDYYAFTTAFMLEGLRQSGRDLRETSALSVGCRVDHLTSFVTLFKTVTHVTMVEMEDAEQIMMALQKQNFDQWVGDFFASTPEDLGIAAKTGDIDVVLSHAAVHCMSDYRYGNGPSVERSDWSGIERPYLFARKLRQLLPSRRLTVIFSCAVADTENLEPRSGGSWLANKRLIESFEAENFRLSEAIYDKHIGGRSLNGPLLKDRFSRSLPRSRLHNFVIGNYRFEG